MAVFIQNDRWKVLAEDFAVRIQIPDLEGFFRNSIPKGRQLIIEPGTRALMIDSGVLVGEVPPGAYTLETFAERLQFWQKNQVTVILARCEETVFTSQLSDVPATEGVCGSVFVEWAVQISDPVPFLNNLFGARESLARADLEQQLKPLVTQALFSACGSTSIEMLAGPDVASLLADQLSSNLAVRLQRYGLKFIDVQSARFECCDLDHQKAKAGENWLATRENQLLRSANQVQSDELAIRLRDVTEKVPLRRALRDAVHSDRFAKIESEEEFRKQLETIDKDRLLRREEKDALVSAYMDRKVDREAAREHTLALLEIERERGVEELQSQIAFAVEQKALEREIDLAKLTQTKESLEWRDELEREREESTHRLQLRREKRQAEWRDALEARELKRDDSWKGLLHQQRQEAVQTEIAVGRADRSRRVAILEAETRSRLAAEQLQVDQQRQNWEREVREKKSTNQLERLSKLQEINATFAERQRRSEIELENLKDDSSHRRDVERIQAMSALSVEALIATAKTDNASLLADLKKHEASQSATRTQQEIAHAQQLNDERLRIYEKLNDTERAKADAIAEAFKQAMQSQQGSVQQMIGGLAQAATPRSVAPWPAVQPGFPSTVPPPMPISVVWYAAIDGQQIGPLSLEQMQGYVNTGQIQSSTLFWRQGLTGWSPATQLPELSGLWAAMAEGPPPLPPPLG